jgi:hypothetical protein
MRPKTVSLAGHTCAATHSTGFTYKKIGSLPVLGARIL